MIVDAFEESLATQDKLKDCSTANNVRLFLVFLLKLTDKVWYKDSQSIFSVCTTKYDQFINNEEWQKDINVTNNNNTVKILELAGVNCEYYILTNFDR